MSDKKKERPRLGNSEKMEVKKARKIIVMVSFFLLALCVTHCAPNKQITKVDEEAALRKRVQEYWSYRIKGEWDKGYFYESPEYKEKMTILAYVNQNSRLPLKWERYDILEMWTSGDEGYVKMNIKYRFIIPQTDKAAFERIAEEKWIKKDNQWYRLSPVL
jgi:hypothetical protein